MRIMPVRLFKVGAKSSISRDETLDAVKDSITVEELELSYDDYVAPMVLWATEDPARTAMALGVQRVVPKGGYIMGLFGGEKKKGKQEYAGLVVEHYKEVNGIAYIKLYNLTKSYQVPVDLMKKYGVDIYKLYYRGLINPFNCRTYDVLLSAKGDKELRGFLEALVEINQGVITNKDQDYLKTLIKELKTSIDMFNQRYHYVVYRCQRIFTACVPTDLKMAISESHVAYLECNDPEQAYYYAAALNYLAYKVIESERSFIRDQFARPAIAITVAGLSWKTVPGDVRARVATLSKQLSMKLPWINYPRQRTALTQIAQYNEFKEIIHILDELVEKDKLMKALELVSASGKEETNEDSD